MRWLARTADEMEAFGERLARSRPVTNGLATVHLAGQLGAGKTTLARGFLRACGVSGTIRSPTYTLVEVYETSMVSIVHLDLYRLLDPAELEPLGLRELACPGYLWLIEWPERGAGLLPPPDLCLALAGDPSGHTINAKGASALGKAWLTLVENGAGET